MKFKETIKLLIGYPGKILKWIKEGRYHNVSIIVTVAAICYFLKVITYEPKLISTIFLIVGLLILISQMIGESRRFAEQKPNTLKNWIKKFPRFKPKTLNINVSSSLIITTGAKAHLRVTISENSSIEEKVNFLMKQKDEMETAINNIDNKLDTEILEVNKKINQIDSKVEETKNIINSTISDVAVGDFDLKFLSMLLMIYGTFIQILI